ncbi:beta strand repeat-containing protein [Frondihabitans australicus]|uniref:Uncharacterized protein DUF3616 n=1 Tax=Frondihabitans australicus TaxID=386892 RepID=A0A495ID78_9MICO|nr:DUF3616 domain-containing protein [Frondihabitans australicus]RKR73963.1 uncharacterized protein DUF3616 [Frondihabitans australicus]
MPISSGSRRSLGLTLAVALSVTGAASLTATGAASASAATASFTPGDVVVYRVGDGTTALSSGATPVFLDEYTPSGTLVQSVPMPQTASGTQHALTASGSSGSEGLLTLSADGRYLIAPGYSAAVGTKKISSTASASTPRTIARVAADGSVDTSTALTDSADGNNVRSATSTNGTDLYVGGAAGGARYTTLGSSTSTELDNGTYKNVRQVSVVDGQLYASADPTKAGLTIGTIGTGTPTTTGQSVTNLTFDTAPNDPYAYSLLTLGTGTAPDTLYEADSTNGTVVKYGLVNGTWTQEGSVLVPQVTGLTANDSNGDVTIYATSAGVNSTTGTLYSITDDSGVGGSLSGVATTVATLPANEAVRGVAFAPGTTIGSGGGIKPPVVKPTISTGDTSLPAALGDTTQQTLAVTVGDTAVDPADLTVTATSSNQAVAADSGISITGAGADRTLSVKPGGVGTSTLTLTVTAPDGSKAQTQVAYGVSDDYSETASKVSYLSGAANASAAVDAGDGYAFVGDDESDTLRLYDMTKSGAPVASFDFDSLLPDGDSEIDIEGASKQGDVIYWEGSMSNSSSGKLAPARSTVFATRVTGTGANATLTYLGSYTGLLADLVAWDQSNGSGLGANYLGLAASSADGVDGHDSSALNVEGLEFASPTSSTAYLAFRAPLEPTTDRHLAMLIPVTNYTALSTAGNQSSTHATFGKPIFMDLGGLGIRDIKENANGQFLIVAGTANGDNTGFSLYAWDGDPAHAPRLTGTQLPQVPATPNNGSWETIVSVPDSLTTGSQVQLVQDDGTVDWYGDGLTSKTGEATGLQKDLAATFTYTAPATQASSLTVTSSAATVAPHTAVTLTATVAGQPASAAPTGSVTFAITGADGSTVTCAAGATAPLTTTDDTASAATCTLPAGTLRASGSAYTVKATYAGSDGYTASTGSLTETVAGIATKTSAATIALLPTTKTPIGILGVVVPAKLSSQTMAGTVTVTERNSAGAVVGSQKTTLPGLLPIIATTVPGGILPVGTSTVTIAYAGNEYYSPSSTTLTVKLTR